MTSIGDIKALIDEYDADIRTTLNNFATNNATLTEDNTHLTEQVASLLEENASLQAQLDALKPQPTPDPTPTDPPSTPEIAKVIIGLSAKQAEWDEQIGNIGKKGIKARRIFCDLGQGGLDQQSLIKQAIADGMMPVLSYKVGGDPTGVMNGKFDYAASIAGSFLKSLSVPVRFVIWHEPNPDITAGQFVAINKRLIPFLRSGKLVEAGTFLNGWLLENKESTFSPYVPDDLVSGLDWWGIDAYHAGTMQNPDPTNTPGRRIQNMLNYAAKRGIKIPIGIGEYNAFTPEAVKQAGDVILANADKIEFACMWSSQADPKKDFRLTGDRLTAFKATLADERVQK